jgi:hypothetical protein
MIRDCGLVGSSAISAEPMPAPCGVRNDGTQILNGDDAEGARSAPLRVEIRQTGVLRSPSTTEKLCRCSSPFNLPFLRHRSEGSAFRRSGLRASGLQVVTCLPPHRSA